jgi:basic membrane lipoprotein Med (substrate-binding protein (PBP1-ABC) superfamily)
MKSKYFVLLALLALVLAPALGVAAQDATEAAGASGDSLIDNVCLVTDLGKVNDGGFNQFSYEGMKKAADEFGLKNTYIETQAPTDYGKNISTCLSEGYKAIVTVGFLLADETLKAAKANPDVYFIGVDQFVGPDADGNAAPKNYVGLQFREDQSGFLAGALAAQMTKTGTIAGVYGIDIPPVKKFRNGFENGAKYINPDIKTLGVYIDSFTAPDRGAAAAAQFLGENADVIFGAGGPTGSGGIIKAACPEADCKGAALVIGVDQDEFLTTFGNGETPGADNIISSAVKRVDQGVYLSLEALVNGGADFQGGGVFILSAENDGIGFAPAHDAADKVPQEVTDKLNEIFAGLKDGSIDTGVDPVTGDLKGAEAATPEAGMTPEATAAS